MPESELQRLYTQIKELGVKMDNLTALFNHAAYGDGFTRCAAQDKRLCHIEENVRLCHTRISGVKRWLVAGLVSVASLLGNFVWNVVNIALRNNQ